MRPLPTLALLLGLLPAATAWAQEPAAAVLRVAPPAKLLASDKAAALLPGKHLPTGSRVSTGANGRLAVQVGGGVLTLGGDSELFLHSTSAGSRADIVRVALARGALRVQPTREARLPLDARLNVGPLRLRALGTDLWAAAETRGETVCLIAGSVSIEAEFGTETLATPGDCLFFSAQNRRMVLKADTADTLARKLERTAFATDVAMGLPAASVPTGPRTRAEVDEGEGGPSPVAIGKDEPPAENTFEIIQALPPPAVEPEPQPLPPPPAPVIAPPVVAVAPVVAEPAPAPAPPPPPPVMAPLPAPEPPAPPPVVAVAPPPPVAAPEPEFRPAPAPPPPAPVITATPAPQSGWLVVLASPNSSEGAGRHAVELRRKGVDAVVRSGQGKHRVVAGPYASREAAAKARAQLQYQLKRNDLWLLQH